MHTKEFLHNQLKNLGIARDDVVMFHSSLRAIGKTENGADGVIDALCEYLSDGLLVVPAYNWDTVNAENPLFDVKGDVTPSLGVLPRVFAKREGVQRSLHPTHSLCAYGKKAVDFVAYEERVDVPCARNGCFGKLLDLNAKIILAGVTFERCSFLHLTEAEAGVPNYHTGHYQDLQIKMHDGTIINRPMFRHDRSCSDLYDRIMPYVKNAKIATFGKFGDANCIVVSTYDLNRVASEVLAENIEFFR